MRKVKKVVIEIETENAAFQDGNFSYQVQKILKRISNDLANEDVQKNYMDINGNKVCTVSMIR